MRPRLPLRPSGSLRARVAVAFGALLTLATLNIGAFYWGARQRARVFGELGQAIERHAALTEARSALEDHAQRVRVVSDLLGVEHAALAPAERDGTLRSIEAVRRRVAAAVPDASDPLLRRTAARADSLARSWAAFYRQQAAAPEAAIAELVVTAEPLSRRLLGTDLPEAIRAQHRRVTAASDAFVRADRASSSLAWAIVALSGVVGAGLAYSLSRDLLRAIGALKAGAERFGAGELAYRVTVANCEELAEVAGSLNAMASRLRDARGELEERNQELARLAFRDPLTTLANRALFRDKVEHALAGRGRRADDVYVLFVDLDDFKAVNDTLGHAAGDALLVDVAERLLNATRGSDTVARLGGDEFAVLLEQVRAPDEAEIVAERVVGAMRAPFAVAGRAVHVGASVGVARGHAGARAEELLRNADVAMYQAKGTGKGRHTVFAPEMHATLVDRLELEAELREAIAGAQAGEPGGLWLAYQPIVELATGRVAKFEALARWTHARRGAVSPATFVPLAEETGAIHALGRWVLAAACREAARWQALAPGPAGVGVSVNVSGRQLEDPALLDDVRAALAAAGLPPQRLTVEITESVFMRDGALRRLRELKSLGVRVAVDDFGTGYSSLAYLQRFPVDVLKIDKAFVDQVARGRSDAAIVRTIVSLGETLRLRTVAEGIEHPEQHEGLLAMGCELGQGYHYARPLTAAGAAEFLAGSLVAARVA